MIENKKAKWEGPVPASELSDDFFLHLEKNIPAVYLWRRCLRLDPDCATNAKKFHKWIINAISKPIVRTSKLGLSSSQLQKTLSIRSDFLQIEGIEIGCGNLSRSKLDELFIQTQTTSQLQQWYLRLKNISFQFGPILYVGQTKCIKSRLQNHLAIDSPLRRRLSEIGLDIDDVALIYLPLRNSTDEERTLLEQILTHILMAPLTYRAG